MDAEIFSLARPMTPGSVGEYAPAFVAPTKTNPRFNFNVSAGRYVLLGLLPSPGAEREAALAAFSAHRARFDDQNLTAFLVLRDEGSTALARDQVGLRWFLDADGAVSRLYGALDEAGAEHPHWL